MGGDWEERWSGARATGHHTTAPLTRTHDQPPRRTVNALKHAARDGDALRALQEHDRRALQRPVAARRDAVRVHVRVRRVAQSEADERDVRRGRGLRARDVEQVLRVDG